jgi:hypothetical protein
LAKTVKSTLFAIPKTFFKRIEADRFILCGFDYNT